MIKREVSLQPPGEPSYSVTTHREISIMLGQTGQQNVIYSPPGACSYTAPKANANTHWELGFSVAVIEKLKTCTARNAHLSARAFPPMITNGFQSGKKFGRHVGRKIAKSMAIVSVHPKNQIEKKN